MWALWALAIMLSIQAGTLDLVETPPGVSNLPVAVPNVSTLPLVMPSPPHLKGSSSSQGSPPRKHPAAPKGGKCAPAARYFLSSGKLHDYLMATLPPQIEDLVKCNDVGMGGVIGTLTGTLDNLDLLSLLDPTSLLQGAGGLGLDGLLGQKGNEESSKPSSGSKATGGLNNLLPGGKEGLGSLLNLGGDKGPGKGTTQGEGLSNIKKTLGDAVEDVEHLKESVEAKVKDILPEDIKGPVSDMLKINIQELVLSFKVNEVKEDSTDITMEGDEIQVHSTVTATIGGEGALGPVITLLQFESNLDVTMKIAISSNNTQCVNLDVQDTHIQVNEMKLQLVETLEKTVPIPVPLPLNKIVPILLTAEMNENLQKSNSCAIVLKDFNDCKNATGLFKYQVQSTRISSKGLSIFYCVEFNLGKKTVPVPGGRLPPDPKNATISVTMYTSMLKMLLIYVAKQSSVKMNNLESNITKIAYAFQKDKLLGVTYVVEIAKDSEDFATGETKLIIAHNSKISKNKLVPDIKIKRSENTVEPPEAKQEVEGIMTEVTKKAWSTFTELFKQMNIPEGVSSFMLMDASVRPLKSQHKPPCRSHLQGIHHLCFLRYPGCQRPVSAGVQVPKRTCEVNEGRKEMDRI
ncbi:vomeromodulin-like [Onychomys torridus]|uniref:vomeromodulin-like n=1 Tax=Onychomys torridus TaxID=38674 RepID=UPI00167FC172|nr:vomeromodulin-like [Onychomys torridus]